MYLKTACHTQETPGQAERSLRATAFTFFERSSKIEI